MKPNYVYNARHSNNMEGTIYRCVNLAIKIAINVWDLTLMTVLIAITNTLISIKHLTLVIAAQYKVMVIIQVRIVCSVTLTV